jgi:hypothetical protein
MKQKDPASKWRRREYVVFLSHSTKDRWVARQMMSLIEQRCKRFGVRVFLDERDIQAGRSIPESIGQRLRACNEFLVLLSRYSLASDWVKFELGGVYFRRNKPIIVGVLDKIEVKELPDLLIPFKAIDLNEFDKYLSELMDRAKRCRYGKKRNNKK